jgi:hypothetical protein
MRVAHYLGFSSDQEVAAPAAANPMANTSHLSNADIEGMLARLQAEKENRCGAAVDQVMFECTGAAPANPPSNGTQG